MLHADLALALRLERSAIAIESNYARAFASLNPSADVEILEVGGGTAIYCGVGSPMSQATGLGLGAIVTSEDLDRLESFYHRRNAPARIVTCPLADASLFDLIGSRGYRPVEFENTTYRPISANDLPALRRPTEAVCRIVGPDKQDRFCRVVGPNFSEEATLSADMLAMMKALFVTRNSVPFLASVGGTDAGGGTLLIHEGLAMIAGAATLPPFRNLGVHSCLTIERLKEAARRGCDLATMGAKPGSLSQRNVEGFGFRVAYTKVVFSREI